MKINKLMLFIVALFVINSFVSINAVGGGIDIDGPSSAEIKLPDGTLSTIVFTPAPGLVMPEDEASTVVAPSAPPEGEARWKYVQVTGGVSSADAERHMPGSDPRVR
jgi:hypothetical protein